MFAWKLILSSICVALLMSFAQAQASSLSRTANADDHSSIGTPFASHDTATAALSPVAAVATSRPAGVKPSWTSFASGPHPNAPAPHDDNMLALRFLFSDSHRVDGRSLAIVAAQINAVSPIAPHPENCETGSGCAVTAAAIPGPIWLMLSVLLGLLGVRTRRAPVNAA